VQIHKSTRHSKLTGDFGRLSYSTGYRSTAMSAHEWTHGIDIIARAPRSREVLGISVKSRSRLPGTERSPFPSRKRSSPRSPEPAGRFCCTPHFGIVIDGGATLRGYIVPMRHLRRLAHSERESLPEMTESDLRRYELHPHVTASCSAATRVGR